MKTKTRYEVKVANCCLFEASVRGKSSLGCTATSAEITPYVAPMMAALPHLFGIWLSVMEDSNGLRMEGRLALRTQKGAEAYELLKLGALTGLSIGCRIVSSRMDASRKARILTDVDLFEVSLVTFPANEAARVNEVKSPRRMNANREIRTAAARLNRAAQALTEKPRSSV